MKKYYAVTGIYHGSWVEATSEEKAKKIFQHYYNGEEILTVKLIDYDKFIYFN